ncbi:MAG: hypothetical protein GY755_18380 [Chloroflexi bacterium]|nr:hypothetical protein [Chloroflexota bacterium]
MRLRIFLFLLFITACTPQKTTVDDVPQLLSLYSSSATEAWMPLVNTCAEHSPFGLVARSHNSISADISLRLIAPANSALTAYQIDEMDVVIVGNSANPVAALTQEQVLAIFEGRIRNWAQVGGDDVEISLWVYEPENDLQQLFNETAFEKRKPSSLAKQAQNMEEMRSEIAKDAYALGGISNAEGDENFRVLYDVGSFPVFAIIQEDAEKELFILLRCLQEG